MGNGMMKEEQTWWGKGRGGFEKGPHNPLSLTGATFSMCSCCGLLLADKSNPKEHSNIYYKVDMPLWFCRKVITGKCSLFQRYYPSLFSSNSTFITLQKTLLPWKNCDHVKLSCKHTCSCSIPSIQPAYAMTLSPHHKAPTRATSKSEEFQRNDSKIFHKLSIPAFSS
jgi:hypothetical protein